MAVNKLTVPGTSKVKNPLKKDDKPKKYGYYEYDPKTNKDGGFVPPEDPYAVFEKKYDGKLGVEEKFRQLLGEQRDRINAGTSKIMRMSGAGTPYDALKNSIPSTQPKTTTDDSPLQQILRKSGLAGVQQGTNTSESAVRAKYADTKTRYNKTGKLNLPEWTSFAGNLNVDAPGSVKNQIMDYVRPFAHSYTGGKYTEETPWEYQPDDEDLQWLSDRFLRDQRGAKYGGYGESLTELAKLEPGSNEWREAWNGVWNLAIGTPDYKVANTQQDRVDTADRSISPSAAVVNPNYAEDLQSAMEDPRSGLSKSLARSRSNAVTRNRTPGMQAANQQAFTSMPGYEEQIQDFFGLPGYQDKNAGLTGLGDQSNKSTREYMEWVIQNRESGYFDSSDDIPLWSKAKIYAEIDDARASVNQRHGMTQNEADIYISKLQKELDNRSIQDKYSSMVPDNFTYDENGWFNRTKYSRTPGNVTQFGGGAGGVSYRGESSLEADNPWNESGAYYAPDWAYYQANQLHAQGRDDEAEALLNSFSTVGNLSASTELAELTRQKVENDPLGSFFERGLTNAGRFVTTLTGLGSEEGKDPYSVRYYGPNQVNAVMSPMLKQKAEQGAGRIGINVAKFFGVKDEAELKKWEGIASRIGGTVEQAAASTYDNIIARVIATPLGAALGPEGLGNLTTLIMSSGAFSDGMYEGLQKNQSYWETVAHSVTQGINSFVTEQTPWQRLFKTNLKGMHIGDLLKFGNQQGLFEGGEELIEFGLNAGSDAIISSLFGTRTDLQTQKDDLINQYGEEKGKREFQKQVTDELVNSLSVAYLSAFGQSGTEAVIQKTGGAMQNRTTGKNLLENPAELDTAIEMGKQSGDAAIRQMAAQIEQKRSDGKLSAGDVGKFASQLYGVTEAEINAEEPSDETVKAVADALHQNPDLNGKGVTEIAQMTAKAVTNGIDSLTKSEKAKIASVPEAQQFVDSFFAEDEEGKPVNSGVQAARDAVAKSQAINFAKQLGINSIKEAASISQKQIEKEDAKAAEQRQTEMAARSASVTVDGNQTAGKLGKITNVGTEAKVEVTTEDGKKAIVPLSEAAVQSADVKKIYEAASRMNTAAEANAFINAYSVSGGMNINNFNAAFTAAFDAGLNGTNIEKGRSNLVKQMPEVARSIAYSLGQQKAMRINQMLEAPAEVGNKVRASLAMLPTDGSQVDRGVVMKPADGTKITTDQAFQIMLLDHYAKKYNQKLTIVSGEDVDAQGINLSANESIIL